MILRIAERCQSERGEGHIGSQLKDDWLSRKRYREIAETGKRAGDATRLLIFVPGRSGLTIRGLVSAIVADGKGGFGRVDDVEVAQGETDEQQLQRHGVRHYIGDA
jgi:hypothetical protein